MPDIIPLQDAVVYGPIASRRLGSSLGINILPLSYKVCSSDCAYCQYGWTPSSGTGERLPRAAALLTQIEDAFETHLQRGTPVDSITLAGNGEPTLHPDLVELVVGIKGLRDRYFSKAPVTILSDATQVTRPKVREALALLDARYMKFDAADEATWQRVNRPIGKVTFAGMLEGLKSLPAVTLQSMFIGGSVENINEPHIQTWVKVVGWLKPLAVQVYTVDRGTAAKGILEVPREQLERIAERLTAATGIPTEVFD